MAYWNGYQILRWDMKNNYVKLTKESQKMRRKLLLFGILGCSIGMTFAGGQVELSRQQALEIVQVNQDGTNEPYVYITRDVLGTLQLIKKLKGSQSDCVSEAMDTLYGYCTAEKSCVPAQLVFQTIYDVVDLLKAETLALSGVEADALRSLWRKLCDHHDHSIYVSEEDLKRVLPQTRAPRTPMGGGRPPAISQEIIAGVNYILDVQPTSIDHVVTIDGIIKGDLYIDHSPLANIFFENSGSSDPLHYDSRIIALDGTTSTLEQCKLQFNSTMWVDGATDRVGVGISTPVYKMDIRGAADVGALQALAINNAAKAIHLRTGGGATATIEIHSQLGTGAASTTGASIDIHSEVGGVRVQSGLASTADAIKIIADGVTGGIDIDSGSGGASDADGGPITINTGAGGSTGTNNDGGSITIATGNGGSAGTDNDGGAITMTTGNGLSTGGAIAILSGNGSGALAADQAGPITITGGTNAGTAIGSPITVTAGVGGTTSGTGGA